MIMIMLWRIPVLSSYFPAVRVMNNAHDFFLFFYFFFATTTIIHHSSDTGQHLTHSSSVVEGSEPSKGLRVDGVPSERTSRPGSPETAECCQKYPIVMTRYDISSSSSQ